MAEKPGRLHHQHDGDGDEAHQHHPVGFQVIGRNGLGIPDEHTGHQDAHGAAQPPHDAYGKGVDQNFVPPFHRNGSQRQDHHSRDGRERAPQRHTQPPHQIGIDAERQRRPLILGNGPKSQSRPGVVGKQV